MKRLSPDAVIELRALASQGTLTPANVVQAAAWPTSALHPYFTWDDTEAATLRRLDEARSAIASVRVQLLTQPEQPPIDVRAFVSLASDRVAGNGYREIEVVLADPDQRAQLLRTALRELHSLQRKYGKLSELAKVFASLDEARAIAS